MFDSDPGFQNGLQSRMGFPGGSDGKESPFNAGDPGSIPGSERIPWRREWLPTPVFLPGEFHGQRSPVGYSPRHHRESDTTEGLTLHFIVEDSQLPSFCHMPFCLFCFALKGGSGSHIMTCRQLPRFRFSRVLLTESI